MGKKSRKPKGGGGVDALCKGGRALQGLVGSGHDITTSGSASVTITDANRGHLAALLGGTKNVMVAGHDLQGLRAALDDPDIDFSGGGGIGVGGGVGVGGVAGPPSILVPPPPAPFATDTNLPPPSIKTMKETILFAGLSTAGLLERGDIEARYALAEARLAKARLAEADRLENQLKKRRHIAESSDDDDDDAPKPLTVEEKNALADSLASLPADKVDDHVIPILEESGARPIGDTDFIDYLNTLDPGTLRRLQTYVAEDGRAHRISITAAVAEAAARAITDDSNPWGDTRFMNACRRLEVELVIDDNDREDYREYLTLTSKKCWCPREMVRIMRRWPRLRKYWPRLRRRFCSYCGKGTLDLSAPRLMVCGGCGQGRGVGRYCSEACQRAHWPEHQKHCPRLDL